MTWLCVVIFRECLVWYLFGKTTTYTVCIVHSWLWWWMNVVFGSANLGIDDLPFYIHSTTSVWKVWHCMNIIFVNNLTRKEIVWCYELKQNYLFCCPCLMTILCKAQLVPVEWISITLVTTMHHKLQHQMSTPNKEQRHQLIYLPTELQESNHTKHLPGRKWHYHGKYLGLYHGIDKWWDPYVFIPGMLARRDDLQGFTPHVASTISLQALKTLTWSNVCNDQS